MISSEEIRHTVSQQKLAGQSSESILQLAKSAHIQPAVMIPVISEFFPGFKTAKNHQPQKNTSLKIWDPANRIITQTSFKVENAKVQKKYEFYKKHPKNLNKKWWMLFTVGVAGSAAFGVWWYIEPITFWAFMLGGGGSDDDGAFGALIVPWVPLFAFIAYIKKMQRDLVKKVIAEKHHWIYSPKENRLHWEKLRQTYPRIFDRGNQGQNLEDEFWGKFKTQKQNQDFYSGIFHYQIRSGHGKNRKTRKYYQTVFAIRLNKVLTSSLMLTPAKKGILGVFKRRKISMESIGFNEKFYIEIDGKNTSNEVISIVQKLSPSVQEKLIHLAEQFPKCTIYFEKDCFFFLRTGFLFSDPKKPNKVKMKTNFFKKVDIHPDDEKFLESKMNTLLEISAEVPQYLD